MLCSIERLRKVEHLESIIDSGNFGFISIEEREYRQIKEFQKGRLYEI